MEEKFLKVIKSKWTQGIVSFVVTFAILWQEYLLGSNIKWYAGIVFSIVFGLFYEGIRAMANSDSFKPLNIWPWIVGGLLSCIIYALQ